ncbi:MAG: hypothetical protein FJ344_05470 [Sphingomonadales bacterium]|nr:hypothetical protein [Sphingomonadales bacterium]
MKALYPRILFFFLASTLLSAFQSKAQYCPSQSNISTDEHITGVTIGALSNPSGGSNYSDYTAQSATVNPGGNPQISVTIYNGAPPGVTWNEYISVFIDWNQDQTFDTLTEMYLVGSCNTNGCTVTGNISVPPTATTGTTRMRVILRYNEYQRNPCGNYTFGETEDYSVVVLPLVGRDVAATAVLSPVTPILASTSVSVTIRISNLAADPINTATVGFQLDGGVPVTEVWTGSLTSGQSVNHTFSSLLILPASSPARIKVWATNANNLGADINPGNDTLRVSRCLALPGGVYLVGGSPQATFPTPDSAIRAISCGGIAGPVTFSIEPGTYYGSYNLNNIPGSGVSSITISSQNGIASSVELLPDTVVVPATGRILFNINHTPGVNLSNLTLRMPTSTSPTTTGSMLVFADRSPFLNVTGCTLQGPALTGGFSFGQMGISAQRSDTVVISGNIFQRFNTAVQLTDPIPGRPYVSGCALTFNQFSNYETVLNARNQATLVVQGNQLTDAAAHSGAFEFETVAGLRIESNKVTGNLGSTVFTIQNPNDSTGLSNQIVNNVVSGRFAGTGFQNLYSALNVNAFADTTNSANPIDQIEVVHNTFHVEMAAPSASGGLVNFNGINFLPVRLWSQIDFRNNHVTARAEIGSALSTAVVALSLEGDSTLVALNSNYNNYLLSDPANANPTNNLIFDNNIPQGYANLSAWRTASGKDLQSISASPVYASLATPIPTSAAVNNMGTPISGVTADITGAPRNATTPDMGAYEFTPSPNDLGVIEISGVQSGCSLGSAIPIQVRIFNFGTAAQAIYSVGYSVNAGTPVTEPVNVNLNPGDTLSYTFSTPINLSNPATYEIKAYSILSSDVLPANDTTTRVVVSIPTVGASALPYEENFENGNGGWIAGGVNNSWALGAPAGTTITTAGTGTQAWVTNLAGDYNNNEQSFVVSPCFDFSTVVNAEISFDLFYVTELNWDKAALQYTLNNGQTWVRLGSLGSGINWYNQANTTVGPYTGNPVWSGTPGSGGWVRAVHSLSVVDNQSSVRFRIAFYSDGSVVDEGIGFDRVLIRRRLDPVILSVSRPNDSCVASPRTIRAQITFNNPVASVSLRRDLTNSGVYTTQPMTLNATSGLWEATIPAGQPNVPVRFFVIATDNTQLADTSDVTSYVDDYLRPNAGADTSIYVSGTATLRGSGGGFDAFLGTGTITNTNITYPAPYGGFYWGARHQFLIRVSELQALNIGAPIVSLAFDVVANQGSPLSNFEIKMGHTSATDLTSWQSGLSTVYSVPSYTDVPGWNTHNFQNPFLWNGQSNVVVEVCFQNGSFTNNAIVNQSATPFVSSYYYRADAQGVCPNTGNSGSISQRPNMRLRGGYAFAWKNLTTGAIVSSIQNPVQVSPVTTTAYEFRLTDRGCSRADTVLVTVLQPLPDVGVSAIVQPTSFVTGQQQTIKVAIKNYSTTGASAVNFDVAYRVNGVEVNSNTIFRQIPPGDTIHHTFTARYTPPTGGDYLLCAYTRSAGDINAQNDTTCRSFVRVGIDPLDRVDVRLYPVPASDYFWFEFPEPLGASPVLLVTDAVGRKVCEEQVYAPHLSAGMLPTNLHRVRVADWPTGMYHYRYLDAGRTATGSFLIAR